MSQGTKGRDEKKDICVCCYHHHWGGDPKKKVKPSLGRNKRTKKRMIHTI